MARKKDNDANLDPIAKLERRRAALEEKLAKARKKSKYEMGELGFWGVVGGVAIAADWVLLGGIGTAFAVLSGAEIFSQSREGKRLQKQITKIDEQLAAMELEKMRLEAAKPKPPAPKAPEPGLKDDFSPAAQKEIEDLRKRLAEMEKKVGEQQDPTLDKPKFGPPKK
ncbi:MAG: hypothetical protein GC185_00405 [Alphaproteobacteria bacterium]|nr:hypothetical protein [Alphaproteobacteria bacterium]